MGRHNTVIPVSASLNFPAGGIPRELVRCRADLERREFCSDRPGMEGRI